VVGGVWEVGVNKINLISFAVDNGSSIGRTCGEAEARGEQLLGEGWFFAAGAWLWRLGDEDGERRWGLAILQSK